jgi:ribosomal protein L20
MTEIIDDLDRDEYPHKLEFRRLWMKRAVIALAVAGAMYWMQLITTIIVKVYFLIAE